MANKPEIGQVRLDDGRVVVFEAILDESGEQHSLGQQMTRFDTRAPFIMCIFRVDSPDSSLKKTNPFLWFGSVTVKNAAGEFVHNIPEHNEFIRVSHNGSTTYNPAPAPGQLYHVPRSQYFIKVLLPADDYSSKEPLKIMDEEGNSICSFPFPTMTRSISAEFGRAQHAHQTSSGPWNMDLIALELHSTVTNSLTKPPRRHESMRTKHLWEYDRQVLNESEIYRFEEHLNDGFGNPIGPNEWSHASRQSMWKYSVKVARSDRMLSMEQKLFRAIGNYSLVADPTEVESRDVSGIRIKFLKPDSREITKFDKCRLESNLGLQYCFLTRNELLAPYRFQVSSGRRHEGYHVTAHISYSFGGQPFNPKHEVKTNIEYDERRSHQIEIGFVSKLPIVVLSFDQIGDEIPILNATDQDGDFLEVFPLPHHVINMPCYAIETNALTESIRLGLHMEPLQEIKLFFKSPTSFLSDEELNSFGIDMEFAPTGDGWEKRTK